MQKDNKLSPWLWIPTLYFAEGIPYFLVNNVSVMMLTRMGVSNGLMALHTSLLYLPWVIKPLWGPFVDIVRTKRWWIILTQIALSACFVGLTLSIPQPSAETIAAAETGIGVFSVMLCIFWLTAFLSATHDIAADGFYMLALDEGDQSLFVGIRSTFYRLSMIFGQGVLITLAGYLEKSTGNIPFAWQMTLLGASVLFAVITLWHTFALPRVEKNNYEKKKTAGEILRDFGETFVSFFSKKGIGLALVFMLLYRLPEALLIKIINPFFVDQKTNGGLLLQTEQVGIIYGTVGVIALTIGGILGGLFVARYGLKHSLWWMALAITLPDAVYVWLSYSQPDNILWISTAIALEQFGYGFGFSAYMLYLIYYSMGEHKTSHYALCTAFMALSMMIPGLFAGALQEAVGYQAFFLIVVAACSLTYIVTAFLKIDPEFGKKKAEA